MAIPPLIWVVDRFNLRIEILVIESIIKIPHNKKWMPTFQSQNWDSCYWERFTRRADDPIIKGFNLRIEILVIERTSTVRLPARTPVFQSQNWDSCYWELPCYRSHGRRNSRVSISELRFLLLRDNYQETRKGQETQFQSQNWDSCYWEMTKWSFVISTAHRSFNLRIEILVIERNSYAATPPPIGSFNLRIEILVIESWTLEYRYCVGVWFQSQNWDSCYWENWQFWLTTDEAVMFQSQNWDSCYWERDTLTSVGFC